MPERETRVEYNAKLVEDAYLLLRQPHLDKSLARRLETSLSTSIVRAERQILSRRSPTTGDDQAAERRHRAVLKRIADALAWRFFGSDEHFLRVCAMGQPAGFMAGKKGYKAERLVIQGLYEHPGVLFAIQNDITNILHLADVTFLWDDGSILSAEIKSGGRGFAKMRSRRQVDRFRDIETYLAQGGHRHVRIAGEPFRALEAPFRREYYWRELEEVAGRAGRDGFASHVCHAAALLFCFRTDVASRNPRGFQEALWAATAGAGWKGSTLTAGCLSRHLLKAEHDIVKYVIPPTAFDVTPAVMLRFLCGELDACLSLNITVLIEALSHAGYSAAFGEEQGLVVTRADSTIDLGVLARPLNWVLYGLLTIPSFIGYIDASFKSSERQIDRLAMEINNGQRPG